MSSQFIKRLLRFLIILLCTGVGIAICAGSIEWYRLGSPGITIPMVALLVAYIGLGLLFALIGLAISNRLADILMERGNTLMQKFVKLPFPQLMSAVLCMILGLLVAALLTNVVRFMGASIFTTAFSAILSVCLGAFGYTIGYVRSKDFQSYLSSFLHTPQRTFHRKTHRAARKGAQRGVPDKLLDASALIDGRIVDLIRIGFIEGDIIIPQFIIEELHHIADSQDPSKKARGQRGLDTIAALQKQSGTRIRTMQENSEDTLETDVRLLRLSRDIGGVVITGDSNLAKVASVSSLPVLNLHELAGILRPVVLPGQTLTALIVKEGREAGQGIAYMEDGTMIVVENGRSHVGETMELTVTSSLQTNAGRMVFAKAG